MLFSDVFNIYIYGLWASISSLAQAPKKVSGEPIIEKIFYTLQYKKKSPEPKDMGYY